MKVKQLSQNCVFVEDDLGDCHCFSYEQEVAAIKGYKYEEYSGPKFNSVTSCKHKKAFRSYYGY